MHKLTKVPLHLTFLQLSAPAVFKIAKKLGKYGIFRESYRGESESQVKL